MPLPPPLPSSRLRLPTTPTNATTTGGGKQAGTTRHKVVFDLHLQHLALHNLEGLSIGGKGASGQGGKGKSSPSIATQDPLLPEALLWQGSENRGALKFRLRLRSPPSICLLLDDSHHEIVIPLANITSLRLLDGPVGLVLGATDEQLEYQQQQKPEGETVEEMEKRLRTGGMVLEMGVMQGCKKDFRLREPNRYVRLSSLPGSARVASGNGNNVEEGDFTGGAAHLTNLVRMTIHSTVTRELTSAMTSLVIRALKARDGQPVDCTVFGGQLASIEDIGAFSESSLTTALLTSNGTVVEGSDGARETVAIFVKRGGVGLPRYRSTEDEGATSGSRQVEEKQQEQPTAQQERNASVKMVVSEQRANLSARPSLPISAEPRRRCVTAPAVGSPLRSIPLIADKDDIVVHNPASRRPITPIGSPRAAVVEQPDAPTRLRTTSNAPFGHQESSSSSRSSSISSYSLAHAQKPSRTSSIATLVLPPSSSFDCPVFSPSAHHQTASQSLGVIGDSRLSSSTTRYPQPAATPRVRSLTDHSLFAQAAARASVKALEERGREPSFPRDLAKTLGEPTVGSGRQQQQQHSRTSSSSSSSAFFPPIDGVFSPGSFGFQYPSPMSTPSSTCVSLSEESDVDEEGRTRCRSFVTDSVDSEEGWFGGGGRGTALGFRRSLSGRGGVEGGAMRSIWSDEGGGGWKEGGVTAGRLASQSFFETNSLSSATTTHEDGYPTSAPTYISDYSLSSSSSRNTNNINNTIDIPRLPSPHAHLPAFLRAPSPDLLPLPLTPPPSFVNDIFGRPTFSRNANATPRPSTTTKSTPLPPPPSSLLPQEWRERPVLPFYPVIDPMGEKAGGRGRWVSS